MNAPDSSSPSSGGRTRRPVSGRNVILFLVAITIAMLVVSYFIARAVLPEAKDFHEKRPSLPPPPTM